MIKQQYLYIITNELGLKTWQVENTLKLFESGCTVPFISRYRKEKTGSLDEVNIINIKDASDRFSELEKRKETILNAIEKQEKLTPELRKKIELINDSNELEDLYLPYKQKKKTRGTKAKELGLEPLAKLIFSQKGIDLEFEAEKCFNENLFDIETVLQGTRDIIAEWVNEDEKARAKIRNLFEREAFIYSKVIKGKEEEGEKFRDYFECSENIKQCSSHRILAMRRGENEGFLKINIEPDEEKAIELLQKHFIRSDNETTGQMEHAIHDAYKRLMKPSIETEFKNSSKEAADIEAIQVFAKNLKQLLLSSPLGQKRVLAIDPGFRSGCKVVCLNELGNLLHNETIFPHPPQNEIKQAAHKIASLANAYKIEAIAIGNGTASRETEYFIKSKVNFSQDIKIFVVSESGASVYSASAVAREEFPQYDVTVRGAVSIGRRLIDPLAELVKIDPKSIGVGQYQHDVNQTLLKKSLENVVESCVNKVGVNVNTASKYLLTSVSGLGPTMAQNIISYRDQNGSFRSREELKKVPRMGEKAFEQSAGFLRVDISENPLDNSAVHPESYPIVEKMAVNQKCTVKELLSDEQKRKAINLEDYVTEKTGIPTLKDIIEELAKPGRDPRTKISAFEFAKGIHHIEDLRTGMEIPGLVTNITKFGAFVDIGVKQDGLVHISQIKEAFVKDPADELSLNQHIKVKILDVDINRKRIQLSMIGVEQPRYKKD